MACMVTHKSFVRTDGGWVCATTRDTHHTLADAVAAVQSSHAKRAASLASHYGITVARRERVGADLLGDAVAAWSVVWSDGAVDVDEVFITGV